MPIERVKRALVIDDANARKRIRRSNSGDTATSASSPAGFRINIGIFYGSDDEDDREEDRSQGVDTSYSDMPELLMGSMHISEDEPDHDFKDVTDYQGMVEDDECGQSEPESNHPEPEGYPDEQEAELQQELENDARYEFLREQAEEDARRQEQEDDYRHDQMMQQMEDEKYKYNQEQEELAFEHARDLCEQQQQEERHREHQAEQEYYDQLQQDEQDYHRPEEEFHNQQCEDDYY